MGDLIATTDEETWKKVCAAVNATKSLGRHKHALLNQLDQPHVLVRLDRFVDSLSITVFDKRGAKPREAFRVVATAQWALEIYDTPPRRNSRLSLREAARRLGATFVD